MGKIIFVLILALGAGFYFPKSRAVLLDKLAPVLEPTYRWSTNGEMKRIARQLETWERSRRRTLSRQNEFLVWIAESFQGEGTTTDSWGTAYRIISYRDKFEIISAGPDLEQGTEDDLAITGTRVRRGR